MNTTWGLSRDVVLSKARFTPWHAAVCVLGMYLIIAVILPPGGFFVGDQGVKYAQIDALARTGELAVGPVSVPASVFRPSFSGPFYKTVGDHYQVSYSPVFAFLALPGYLAFGLRGLILPSIVGGVIAAYASGRIGEMAGAKHPWAIVLLTGLLSPLLFYALVLWEQAFAAGLLTAAAYLCLRRHTFSAGLLAGMAVWFRPEAYLFGPALCLAFFFAWNIRKAFWSALFVGLGFLAALVPWWTYNFIFVGSPLGAQMSTNSGVIQEGLSSGYRFVSLSFQLLPIGQKKWLAMLVVVAATLVVLKVFKRSGRPALWLFWFGVVVIGLWHVLGGAIVDSHSIFDVFPFAFASIVTLFSVKFSERPIRFLWALIATYAAGVLLLAPDAFMSGWGTRLLLGIYPFLAVLAWLGYESIQDRLGRLTLTMLLALGLAVQVAAMLHLNGEEKKWATLNAELQTLSPKVVATGIWWLPQIAAPTFRDTRWYGIVDARDLDAVTDSERSFWWIWTNEDTRISGVRAIGNTSVPPIDRVSVVTTRQLSTRGLQAVLYEIVR